jgi:glycosyltransferase involved in cell wall biosynthesis
MPVQEWSVPASKWGPLSLKYGFHGRRLVTIFGFATAEKDYSTALRAIVRVRKDHPEALLVIAGGARDKPGEAYMTFVRQFEQRLAAPRPVHPALSWGPGVQNLRAEVETPALRELPWRETGYLDEADARAILEQTDVALLPYRSGTGSYAAGAALVSGCPLVTSDLPAFAEPLPALRFRAGDVQDLADKLNSILSDDVALAAAAARSRRYAAENSWARAAERHVALYREYPELVRRAA